MHIVLKKGQGWSKSIILDNFHKKLERESPRFTKEIVISVSLKRTVDTLLIINHETSFPAIVLLVYSSCVELLF